MTCFHSLKMPLIKKSQTIFKNSIIEIKSDLLQQGDSPPYHYYTLKASPIAVIVLAFTSQDQIVAIHEYRHPAKAILLSLPAGYVEQGEDPVLAAQRELIEETGYDANAFEIIGEAYPYAGISTQKNLYIKAKEAYKINRPQLEKSEIIETVLLSKQELLQQVRQGSCLDANLMTAMAFHYL